MRHAVVWICAALALAIAIVYRFGLTPLTILLGLLLLFCPVVVVWLSLRLSKQCERDIRSALEREREYRKNH
ncbi:hypothetical protein [Cupriavidus sp. UYPR2.512]|uniref:hypothetical protein n=1 Tax=Cupriavidus sp. UYPR2.512 TaxID=1080187 RepID=UPI000360F2CD|nr:hypothetical protein [Cupriavidus sp. UYPR2.512]UIF86499.1 hypothetical protein KAF44_02175 [Cupriavidus necator]